ncbi:hypothetical protein Ddye_009562, partial [Dipteronia dyeriana]
RTIKQQSLNDTILKERTHACQRYVAKLVYQVGIPFNVIDNDCFLRMVKAIGRFEPSFKPPSQWQLREPLLNEEFGTTKEALKKQELSWKVDGCSIMTDYELIAIEEVGPKNVVQVVTDNTFNNMAATKMLKTNMQSIFWSSCATHTINIMFEGIGNLPKFKNTLVEAKSFTIFIYAPPHNIGVSEDIYKEERH